MEIFNNIELDKNNAQYLYIQLYNILKDMIIKGKLKPNTKLPPIRKLARKLDINNVTVVNAYKLLEQNNFVYKKIGSGTYVKDSNNNRSIDFLIDDEINLEYKNDNIEKIISFKDNLINFASGVPTPDLFPVSDFKIVLNEVLDRDKGNAFGYQESEGYYPLRESIKSYIAKYGIKTNVENIQIISGAQQGIDIISKTLIDYGDTIFLESPTYTGAIDAFKSRSARIVEIPINEDGIDLNVLENKLRVFSPKFIYIMTNFQNPTGFSYSLDKKKKILDLAGKYNFYIIEDDYLSDLSFHQSGTLPLKALDNNDKVIYIKSFSKIFMPGLRLAFMIIPLSIYNDILITKQTTDISTSSLIQRAFDLYLRKGTWEKHIKYMESIYKERFEIMVDSIRNFISNEIDIIIPKGGLNFWFSLPDRYSANELYNFCLKNNIVIVPGSVFFVDQKDSKYFRISVASVYTNQISYAMSQFGNILNFFLKEYKNKKSFIAYYRPLL